MTAKKNVLPNDHYTVVVMLLVISVLISACTGLGRENVSETGVVRVFICSGEDRLSDFYGAYFMGPLVRSSSRRFDLLFQRKR